MSVPGVQTAVDRTIQTLQYQTLIAVIRDTVHRFEEGQYRQLLSRITGYSAAEEDTETVDTKGDSGQRKLEYISFGKLRVDFDKPWLGDADDVDRYLKRLRETILQELQKGKRIQI